MRFLPSISLAALLCAGLAAVVPASAIAQGRAELAEGRKIAQEKCAGCHSIGKAGKSRAKAAPPFRTLATRYNLDDLEEAFVEGVTVRHGAVQMPEFAFSPDATAALIAYIKALGRPKAR